MSEQKVLTVAALTSGQNTPSTRFRVRQYIHQLAARGIEVTELIPRFGASCGLPSPFKMASRLPAISRSRDADLVWLSRHMVQGYAFFERSLKRPRVLDVDDAVWLRRPIGRWAQPWIARGMDAIIAGNRYLADYYRRYCANVHIVPTTIDLQKYQRKNQPPTEPEEFIIVWTGLARNYQYLDSIADILARFLQGHPRASLLLIANRPWQTGVVPANRIRFVPWSPDVEASALREASVGIMPLSDDAWTRGKCSFKLLQYMAVGLPVVASPVGMNRDILRHDQIGMGPESADEWYDALKTLHDDWSQQQRLGEAGRKVVEASYSAESAVTQLAEIFRQVVASTG